MVSKFHMSYMHTVHSVLELADQPLQIIQVRTNKNRCLYFNIITFSKRPAKKYTRGVNFVFLARFLMLMIFCMVRLGMWMQIMSYVERRMNDTWPLILLCLVT